MRWREIVREGVVGSVPVTLRDDVVTLTFFSNPTAQQARQLLSNSMAEQLRGLVSARRIVVFDAYLTTHHKAKDYLRDLGVTDRWQYDVAFDNPALDNGILICRSRSLRDNEVDDLRYHPAILRIYGLPPVVNNGM